MQDKVKLLLGGAADYITKPFDTAELLARIAVQLRKAGSNLSDRIIVGDLQLDLNAHTLRVKNSEIRLTKTEVAILKLLMQNPGQVLPSLSCWTGSAWTPRTAQKAPSSSMSATFAGSFGMLAARIRSNPSGALVFGWRKNLDEIFTFS